MNENLSEQMMSLRDEVMEMKDREKIIKNLSIAKQILIYPQMLSHEMCIRIGQAISAAIALLKEQEPRELTINEWHEWKADSRRNPICMLWEKDTSPIWILNPNDVHEPAFLIGKLKLFTGKPTFEQCKAVKWK